MLLPRVGNGSVAARIGITCVIGFTGLLNHDFIYSIAGSLTRPISVMYLPFAQHWKYKAARHAALLQGAARPAAEKGCCNYDGDGRYIPWLSLAPWCREKGHPTQSRKGGEKGSREHWRKRHCSRCI